MPHISRVKIDGFKSIRHTDLELSDLDVLIGLNGSGKSNLLSFFSMLGHIRTQSLQQFVQVRSGGASSLLHGGPTTSSALEWRIDLQRDRWKHAYQARLVFSADDSLIFDEELVDTLNPGQPLPFTIRLSSKSRESAMNDPVLNKAQPQLRAVWTSLRDIRYFQFHNTSMTSSIRRRRDAGPASQLHDDAGNLYSFLDRLHTEGAAEYATIVSVCREVIPWFDDFVFNDSKPSDKSSARLTIRERSGFAFPAHQLSDGTLRFVALTTLLSQPLDWSPDFVCIDEPELGLFPAALSKLADLLLRRSQDGVQVLLATQSRDLLRYLGKDPIVAERLGPNWSETVFRRLSPVELDGWYDEYTQGDEMERR